MSAREALREGNLKVLETVRAELSARRYSTNTQKAYVAWVRRFVVATGARDLSQLRALGAPDVTRFLACLAKDRRVSPSTQNQALAALRFLFERVLGVELVELERFVHPRTERKAPEVLTVDEVARVLGAVSGAPHLMAALLCHSGLRLMECCKLRVMDVSVEREELMIRQEKSNTNRVAPLPRALVPLVLSQLKLVQAQHARDLARGGGWAKVPTSVARKSSELGRTYPWQWLFPATRQHTDPETGQIRRHHLHPTVLQRAVQRSAALSTVGKHVDCRALQRSFASHLLTQAAGLRGAQKSTTAFSGSGLPVLEDVCRFENARVRSPLTFPVLR